MNFEAKNNKNISTRYTTSVSNKTATAGITLIALVITIIVLLILAGVSIASLTGENGILTRAQTSRKNTEDATVEEKVKLAVQSAYTEGKGIIERDNLDKELKELFGTGKYELSTGEAPWTVTVEDYEATVNSKGKVAKADKDEEVVLDSTEETTPWLPTEDTIVTNNDLDTGLTIKDSKGNEWVWIEVPKSVTASATTDSEIETVLKNYAAELVTDRGEFADTWYDGCGLEKTEYNTVKSTMLQSVKDNGGFYIGKYEVGYELKEGESTRSFGTENTIEHPITQTPVIKQNVYPYNWVQTRQAQELSEKLATGGKTTSLLFGTQWDLVLKYLYEKGAKTAEDLTVNSGEWGNYYDTTFEITQGKYAGGLAVKWEEVKGNYSKPTGEILLTTGATKRNSSMNIYDLAGNVMEWTLEKSSNNIYPCSGRGAAYYSIWRF